MLVYVAVSCPRSTLVPGKTFAECSGYRRALANRCRRATTRRLFHSGARKVWNNCSLVILFELREATLNGCACRPNDAMLPRWIIRRGFFSAAPRTTLNSQGARGRRAAGFARRLFLFTAVYRNNSSGPLLSTIFRAPVLSAPRRNQLEVPARLHFVPGRGPGPDPAGKGRFYPVL